jgi:hypothetical protein
MAKVSEDFVGFIDCIKESLEASRSTPFVIANKLFAKEIISSIDQVIDSTEPAQAVSAILNELITSDQSSLPDIIQVFNEEGLPVLKKIDLKCNPSLAELQETVLSFEEEQFNVTSLCNRYDSLMSSIRTEMRNVSVEDLKAPLEAKMSRHSTETRYEFLKELSNVKTNEEFFSFIQNHNLCGFLNYHLLSIYSVKHGSKKLQDEMMNYEKAFQVFARAIKMKDLLSTLQIKPTQIVGLPSLEVMLDDSWDNRSLCSLNEVCSNLFTWWKFLMLSDGTRNCIKLQYFFFLDILEEIEKDLNNSRKVQQLKQMEITITLHHPSLSKHKSEESNCPICTENWSQYKIPKVLSCGHCFCLDCLEKINLPEPGKITCPLCRTEEDLPVTCLPTAEYKCSTSDCPNVAVVFCEECDDLLCEICKVQHSKFKATRDHTIRSIEETNKFNVCTKHNKKLELYCATCNQVICDECFSEVNSSHSVDTHDVHKIDQLISQAERVMKKMQKIQQKFKLADEAANVFIDNFKMNLEKVQKNWKERINIEQSAVDFDKVYQFAVNFTKGENIPQPEEIFKKLCEGGFADNIQPTTPPLVIVQWLNELQQIKISDELSPDDICVKGPSFAGFTSYYLHVNFQNVISIIGASVEPTITISTGTGPDGDPGDGAAGHGSTGPEVTKISPFTWFVTFKANIDTNDIFVNVTIDNGVCINKGPFSLPDNDLRYMSRYDSLLDKLEIISA